MDYILFPNMELEKREEMTNKISGLSENVIIGGGIIGLVVFGYSLGNMRGENTVFAINVFYALLNMSVCGVIVSGFELLDNALKLKWSELHTMIANEEVTGFQKIIRSVILTLIWIFALFANCLI